MPPQKKVYTVYYTWEPWSPRLSGWLGPAQRWRRCPCRREPAPKCTWSSPAELADDLVKLHYLHPATAKQHAVRKREQTAATLSTLNNDEADYACFHFNLLVTTEADLNTLALTLGWSRANQWDILQSLLQTVGPCWYVIENYRYTQHPS